MELLLKNKQQQQKIHCAIKSCRQSVMNLGRTSRILILFVTPVLYGSNFAVVRPLPGEKACVLWALQQDLAYNPSTGLRETSGGPDTSGDEYGPQRCSGEQEALGTNLQS